MIIGLAFVYLGVASISLPYYAGSWNVWGGIVALIGGLLYIVATIRESGKTALVAAHGQA